MPDRKPRITPQHPRPGITHHFPDLFPHSGFVAMYRAIFAGGFFVAIGAIVKALQGIIPQRLTFGARKFMFVATAVNRDHGGHSSFFYFNVLSSDFAEH